MKKIGIVGSRRRDSDFDFQLVKGVFADLYDEGDIIVSGGCPKGGDRFAEMLAEQYDIPIIIHYPNLADIDKTKHPRWEYARVCFARNTLIANDSDVLIACVAEDRKGGTEDTIKKFLKRNKNLIFV